MHIPLALEEVASFLKIPVWVVEGLVRSGHLKRTIGCPYRPNPALYRSSIYDVLEFMLWAGNSQEELRRETAALWVCVLAECDEEDGFQTASTMQQTAQIVETAVCEGFAVNDKCSVRIAENILSTRTKLVRFCEESDRNAA